ncbi:MAG TPA: hypothetical protein VK841_27150 [Polyangiaceae bacterium]|nr:hypothetical protein [Polyangiaceae bacterium]
MKNLQSTASNGTRGTSSQNHGGAGGATRSPSPEGTAQGTQEASRVSAPVTGHAAGQPAGPVGRAGHAERRRHRVYVTHNTEYHIRDRRCVAVRDRRTGEFLQGHLALDRSVAGGLKFFVNGGIAPNLGEPRPGESLYFASEGRDLVTSPLESVERPTREVVLEYPHPRESEPGAPRR